MSDIRTIYYVKVAVNMYVHVMLYKPVLQERRHLAENLSDCTNHLQIAVLLHTHTN